MEASLTGTLSDLTLLIVACLVFAAFVIWVIRFGEETKLLLKRAGKIEAKHKDSSLAITTRDEAGGEGRPSHGEEAGAAEAPADDKTETKEASNDGQDRADDAAGPLRLKAFVRMREGKDDEETEALWERVRTLETDPFERKLDLVRRLYGAFLGGTDAGALEKIEQAADEDSEIAGYALSMLGRCLLDAGKPDDAADAWKRALQQDDGPRARAQRLASRAQALRAAGKLDLADAELRAALAEPWAEPEAEAEVWVALAVTRGEVGDSFGRGLARLRAAELLPTDVSARFEAGWALSNADEDRFRPLILHEYDIAISFSPDHQAALNNTGASLQGANLSAAAVDYYRRASKAGSTLADSNLAYLYLNAGFVDDAARVLEAAEQAEKPHQNVAAARSALAGRRADQTEALSASKQQGQRIASFMAELADETFRPRDAAFVASGWELDGSAVEATLKGDNLTFEWNLGKKKDFRFQGTVHGNGAHGTYEKGTYWLSDERSGWEKAGDAYLILRERSAEMLVVNRSDHSEVRKNFDRKNGERVQTVQ